MTDRNNVSKQIKAGKKREPARAEDSKNGKKPEARKDLPKLMNKPTVAILLVLILSIGGLLAYDFVQYKQNTQERIDLYEVDNPVQSITLISSPSCGCCGGYVQELLNNDIEVKFIRTNDYLSIKEENSIPKEKYSCHTAIYDSYFVEGHVPIEAVNKLLLELPEISGIALPGMPAGSPGMGGKKSGSFEILAIKDGVVMGIFLTL